MSHDETSGPVTRKERRAAQNGKRQSAPRHAFSASEHIREDFTTDMLVEFLESKARGFNGHLRQLLCTSAHRLRFQKAALRAYEEAGDAAATELDEVVNEMVAGDANVTHRLALSMGMVPSRTEARKADEARQRRSEQYSAELEAELEDEKQWPGHGSTTGRAKG